MQTNFLTPNNEKATQTVGLDNANFSAKLETVILRNQIITELNKIPSNDHPVSFSTIYGNREKFKYFTGLYPEHFDALFQFLGPAKYHLTYWNRSKVQKFSIVEQLFVTLLRLRRAFNVKTLAHFYGVGETIIRRIFTTWIMFLYHHFKDYRAWPTNRIRPYMSHCEIAD